MDKKRILVVGSGVAGLAVAEIFARNHHHVVVAERNRDLGGVSSRAIQNWFHTGNLYLYGRPWQSAPFYCNGRLASSIYASVRRGNEVVNLDADGAPVRSAHPRRWFNPKNPIYYCHAKTGNGIPSFMRFAPLHKFWFKNVVIPKLMDSNRPFSFMHGAGDLERALYGAHNTLAHDDFYVLKSSDTTLYSDNILSTLVALCRSRGVQFVTGADTQLTAGKNRNGAMAVEINGSREYFDSVFLAAGAGNVGLLRHVNVTQNLRTLHAPILVAQRQIFPRSFVIISPNRGSIFNHILYRTTPGDSRTVSTFSRYTNVPSPSTAQEDEFKRACMRRFELSAQDIAGVYWGSKTEQPRFALNRKYTSVLNRINDHLYCLVPGKFSLFPYLAALVMKEFGLTSPAIDFDQLAFEPSDIGPSMVRKLLEQTAPQQMAAKCVSTIA